MFSKVNFYKTDKTLCDHFQRQGDLLRSDIIVSDYLNPTEAGDALAKGALINGHKEEGCTEPRVYKPIYDEPVMSALTVSWHLREGKGLPFVQKFGVEMLVVYFLLQLHRIALKAETIASGIYVLPSNVMGVTDRHLEDISKLPGLKQ